MFGLWWFLLFIFKDKCVGLPGRIPHTKVLVNSLIRIRTRWLLVSCVIHNNSDGVPWLQPSQSFSLTCKNTYLVNDYVCTLCAAVDPFLLNGVLGPPALHVHWNQVCWNRETSKTCRAGGPQDKNTHQQGLTLAPTKCGQTLAVACNTVTLTGHFDGWHSVSLTILS